MSIRTRAYLQGLEGNKKQNELRNEGIVSDLGVLSNNNFLYQGGTTTKQNEDGTSSTLVNNTLNERGRAELLKRDKNGNLVNERLITSILTADPVTSSYTDVNTGKRAKGKISKVRYDAERGSNILEVDTPQGFFPKTLGLTNKEDDIVAEISDEDLLEMIDQSIIYNKSLAAGGDMLYAGGKRQGVETIGAEQDDYGSTITEINQAVENDQISPGEAAQIRAELAEEKKRLGGVAPADEAPAVDSQPSSGFISVEDAKNITKKSPQVSGPYGGSSEQFNITIINNPKFRNYIPDPSAKNPFGLSDEEMDQLTVGQRKDLEGREKSLVNMNVNRIVTQQIKGLRDDLRNIDAAQINREEQANLEKLGKAAGIDPNPYGRFLPTDFIDNKNLERTKNFFKENPAEFKKFVDDPRGYLSGALSEDTPDSFNFVAEPTGDQNLDAQVKDSGIPPIPDPKTDPEGFNNHITTYAQQYQELGADPKIVSRAQSYVQKHNVTDPRSFQAAPVVDRDLNVSKALVAIAIAENARLAGGSFEDSFKANYNLFDVGTPGQDRYTAAATDASILKNYEAIRKSRVEQLFPDFQEKYDYITDIDFFVTDKDSDDNVVASRYKDPRSDVQLTSQVRNAFATLKNNNGFRVLPNGQVQYASEQDRSATALLHGEYFLSLVNNIGSVDFPDWFDDWLGTSNAANSPAEVLQRVRVNTKIVKGKPVINEIFLIKPMTGSEAEESFKLPELANFYGDQSSDFRATFIQLIPKDRRGGG